MAGEKNAGSIVYEISADVEPLLQGGKQAIDALDKLDAAAQQSGKGMDNLDQSASQTGSAFTELAGYANSMDNQLRKLNTSVSGIARAMEEARTGTGSTTSEFNRANAVIEALGNQVAILEEAQVNGARSAAVFASQLRAGANATEEEKRTIAELAGAFYDMKASSDEAAKSAASIAAATQRAESSISGLEKEVSILNTEMQAGSRSAAILAAQLSAGEGASDAQKAKIAQLAGSLFDMKEAQKSASLASAEAAKQLAQQANEANRISGITSDLSHQIAILSEQQTNGARSAAILAAQLRAGANATEADKQKIGELTGQLFDMKRTTDVAAGGNKNWKSSMQQAGYQVNDFIVQVQGGQSALVAFSQQGSQLAGAFGPSGAVIGAVIALGSIIAGTLITSLNGGKNAMDALKDAAEAMDKVITVSQNGVAALSDKYAYLAKTNAEVATLMRNQALLEYNEAINKIPKAISDASSSLLSFGDKALSAFTGGYASVDGFNERLASLEITTDNYSDAMKQAYAAGQAFQATTNSIGNTVGAVADKFGITEQRAFELSKQLSDIAKNPSPEALQRLATELQNTQSSTEKGQTALTAFIGTLVNLSREAVIAKGNVAALKQETDNLTSGQKNLIKQSERNLALSKLQGEARARLQAQYAAEDAGFAKDDPHAKQMEDDAASTYKNTQAQKSLQSEQKKGASQTESITKKLENLRAASDLTTESIEKRRIQEAGLRAQQSLGSSATQQQLAEAKALGEANEQAAISIQKRKEAEQGQKFAKQEIASTQAKVDPVTGKAIDPLAQVNLQEQQKLEALAKYQELDKQNTALYEQAKIAIQSDAAMQRKQIADDENEHQRQNMSALLGATSDFFGQMAGAIGDYAGESSAAYKTLFAISKGFAIAQAGMNLVMAISNAAALPWPANIPAIAAAAAQGANLLSQIRGANYGGGRENGGPVGAGSLYEVGEKNRPEILQMNGKNFMIPGNNGRVISNKDLSGGIPKASNGSNLSNSNNAQTNTSGNQNGGIIIYNNVQNYTSATVDSQARTNADGSVTIDTIVADISQGGRISQAIQQNHQAPRKARS